MDYSIVIPVFNKAALTRHCLRTIRATLDGAGEGEIIVIDNASSDETPEMLKEFPWARVVRNEVNLGFAGANNQGAKLASGKFLVLLNNDTEAKPGWLAAMLRAASDPSVGAVGAKLLFPEGNLQHAGVIVVPFRFGGPGFGAFHDLYKADANHPAASIRKDYQVVTGACLVTPRALYEELGGLDEGFWNGYEDIDYCLKVRARGLRVVYEPGAVLTHFESQSGTQRWRRTSWNIDRLTKRWNGRVQYDMLSHNVARGTVRREIRQSRGNYSFDTRLTPPTTIICHGDPARRFDDSFVRALHDNSAPVDRVEWPTPEEALETARREMERRGDRYVAFVDARARLNPGWLDELVRQAEYGWTVGASTFAPELPSGEDVSTFAADARCTLLALRKYPQHLRLDPDFRTLDGALADFVVRGLGVRAAVRGSAMPLGELPAAADDALFTQRYEMSIARALTDDVAPVERALRATPGRRDGLISIVMLSWNAPQFTKLALESIQAHTPQPYEVIIVDNGSKAETTDWLRTLSGVRVIYNETNRGYAGGNNQGIAAARGEYVVLLNNDVIVTEGWLDGLLDAFDRVPGLGVSAPRSNRVAGHQVTIDSKYADIPAMHAYANERRARWRGQGYITDRAIGLCLCVDRRVIEEVGGIDERFGVGNFEDDDFCLRVRSAGYRIYVCDDVFIHHFGSQTFAANKIDYSATMRENWTKFAAKWDFPKAYPENGYQSGPAIARGFDRARHYVPVSAPVAARPPQGAERSGAERDVLFTAVVRDERDWNDTANFVKRYLQAFDADSAALLSIAAAGSLDADTIAKRIGKIAGRLRLDEERTADIAISDETDVASWVSAAEPAKQLFRLDEFDDETYRRIPYLADRSPSDLRKFANAETVVPA